MRDYVRQLELLHPVGLLWDSLLCEGSRYLSLLKGIAVEFTRVDDRATALIEESDTQTTVELLSDWETAANIPDDCSQLGETIAFRQQNLTAKVTEQSSDTIQQLIDIADAHGFSGATVTEFSSHDVSANVDAPLYDEDWRFAIKLNVPDKPVVAFNADSTVDESLGEALAGGQLECAILKAAPAHSVVIFNYI